MFQSFKGTNWLAAGRIDILKRKIGYWAFQEQGGGLERIRGLSGTGLWGRGSLGEDWYRVLSGARWWGEAGLVQGLECFQEQGSGGRGDVTEK